VAGVRLDRVSKTYPDGTQAVHDVDLDIGDGEFMATSCRESLPVP
jgi:ABC-type phosphate/phosphonate transport system ATPase subunit